MKLGCGQGPFSFSIPSHGGWGKKLSGTLRKGLNYSPDTSVLVL